MNGAPQQQKNQGLLMCIIEGRGNIKWIVEEDSHYMSATAMPVTEIEL